MNKSWTKYGGPRGGNEAIYNTKDWYCQSCQKKMDANDVCFNYYHNAIYLSVCQQCASNDCEPVRRRLANMS